MMRMDYQRFIERRPEVCGASRSFRELGWRSARF